YPQILHGLWSAPAKLTIVMTVLVIAWVHGCIGLHFWLRLKPFYRRAAPFLLAAAVLVPTLAMLGVYQGGRAIAAASVNPDWQGQNLSARNLGTPAEQATLDRIAVASLLSYLGLVGFVLLARGARALNERRGGMITLAYGNGRTIRVARGLSVLEASL